MFQEIANRDAWSTIRGFVYQVDITILRWLALRDTEVLELERGEDIDIVSRELSKQEVSRELEQVKYREADLTLNQEAALDLLLNFFLHQQNNPGQRIFFRYVSNSGFGMERPGLFSDGKSGIEVWMELARKPEKDIPEDERVEILQTHLIRKCDERIAMFPDPVASHDQLKPWENFKAYLSIRENITKLVQDFEWSLQNYDATRMGDAVKAAIATTGIVTDSSQLDTAYARLFLFVFKTLSIKGLKQLDLSQLQTELELKSLTEADQAVLTMLSSLLTSLYQRVSAVEATLEDHTVKLNALFLQNEQLEKIDAVFGYRMQNLPTQAPALIKNGASRKEKIGEILGLLAGHTWVALQGINGTGKSQLASLVCRQFTYYWLDLRPYQNNALQSNAILEIFLAAVSGINVSPNRQHWMKEVIAQIPNGTVMVINDLPKLELNDPLSELLILLSQAIQSNTVRLLTTSNFKVPANVQATLTTGSFQEYYEFEFSVVEIEEYLTNNNAPDHVVRYAKLIAGVSHRNPRLVGAIVNRLKTVSWDPQSTDIIDELFNKELTAETLADAQQSIAKIIVNADSRELLYRMSLFNWDLSLDMVKAMARVETAVQHPNERLADLLHIWVQEQRNSHYQISPLIYKLGEKNLDTETVQSVNVQVAEAILATKEIDAISASRCIASFLAGKATDRAGAVLMNVYLSATTADEAKVLQEWGYLIYWNELDTPRDMNVLLRGYLRNEQIRLGRLLNNDTTKFERWLRQYIDQTENANDKVLLRVLLLNHFNERDIDGYFKNFDEIVRHWEDITEPYAGVFTGKQLTNLLWVPVPHLIEQDQLERWISSVELAELRFKLEFFDDLMATSALTIIAEKFIRIQSQKAPEQQDWNQAFTTLSFLETYFKKRKLEVLQAVMLKEIIALEIQIRKDLDKAEEITETTARTFTNPEAQYFLFETLGKALRQAGRKEEAYAWLKRAVSLHATQAHNYEDTLITLAAVTVNTQEAVTLCEELVAHVKTDVDSDILFVAQFEGELAVAYWLNGEDRKSFALFEKVVTDLFALKDKHFGDEWKRLVQWCGHCLGYIATAVAKERVPETVENGEPYTKPYVGIYTFTSKDAHRYYDPVNEALIFVHLANFAAGLEDVVKAYQSSLKAFDLARKSNHQRMLYAVSTVSAQFTLINFKVAETLEVYLMCAAIISHTAGDPKDRYEKLLHINIQELLKNKPSPQWSSAEDTTIRFAIIPLYVMALTDHLDDHPEKKQRLALLKKEISNYQPQASDKDLWTNVLFLFRKIFSSTISEVSTRQWAERYANEKHDNLQHICILGSVFISKNPEFALRHLLNIFPVLLQNPSFGIIRFVYLPFAKSIGKKILAGLFMGSKDELREKINAINAILPAEPFAVQHVLRIVASESALSIPPFVEAFLNPEKKP